MVENDVVSPLKPISNFVDKLIESYRESGYFFGNDDVCDSLQTEYLQKDNLDLKFTGN